MHFWQWHCGHLHFCLKDFGMCTQPQLKYMKMILKLQLKSSDWLKNLVQHNKNTATLTLMTVSMMSNDDRCFLQMNRSFWLPLPWCAVLWLWWMWPLCIGLPQQDSPLRNTMPPRQISLKALIYPHPEETDHMPPIMVPDMGDISAAHSHTAIPTVTGAAVSEGTHHHPHPATTATHTTLWAMDVPIVTHTVTHPTGTVEPHPTLATSPADVTHATIP